MEYLGELWKRSPPKEKAAQWAADTSLRQLNDLKFAIDQASIVTTSDAYGNIVYANDRAVELYGYSREELMGKNHRILSSGIHSRQFYTELWQTILSGKTWRGEICNKSKNGQLHWLDTTIVPFLDEFGEPHQFMSIRMDITEKVRTREELDYEREKRSAIERLTAVGEVAANIAHEIRNPLSTIKLQSQLLRMLSNDAKLTSQAGLEGIKKIEGLVTRIDKIISGLLSLSRDATSDPMEKTSVAKIIESTMDFCRENLEKHGICLLQEIPDTPLYVKCRSGQISQVLLNLLVNSRDAIENLPEKWIRIKAEEKNQRVFLTVADSGTSLTPKLRSRIMEPFFTTKKAGKGTGLGLSISRRIIEQHGGELLLLSDRNTTFQVNLPASPS